LVTAQSGSLIAGVGINGNNQPPLPGIALATLAQQRVDLTEVAAVVIAGVERGYETWHNHGWLALQPLYHHLLWKPQAEMGVDAQGCLVMDGQTYAPGHVTLGYSL